MIAGMTLLDYFAAHAPTEIPAWFELRAPNTPPTDLPTENDVPEVDRAMVRDWLGDSCYDLPDSLRWFQEKWEGEYVRRAEWKRQQEIDRYYAWRWSYASNMLAESQKP